ncbi:MAG: type II toxin-antitoxin system VapC family toxin [Candidatus Kariarchaeaceae archaeon]
MILLDSDIIIELINIKSNKTSEIINRLDQESDKDLAISALVLEEVLFGIFKRMGINRLPPEHPLSKFPVIAFTKEDAEIAAQVEVEMEKFGSKKPRGDILIASTALRTKSQFFSFNHKHYAGIPDLKLI